MVEREYRIRSNGDKIAILGASDFDVLLDIERAAKEALLLLDNLPDAMFESGNIAAVRDDLRTVLKAG